MTATVASPETPVDPKQNSFWRRLEEGRTTYDFVGNWKKWFLISGTVIAIGLVSLFGLGLNRSIDFTGGTVWELRGKASETAVKDATGLNNARVQTVGSNTLRVQARLDKGKEAADRDKVSAALAKLTKTKVEDISVNFIGPTWGKDVSNKARSALIVFFVVLAAYISVRFEWRMALAALAAVFHDVLITVGIYTLSRFEVTPATVIAFLTILGFSLYDTIVVFDKLDENVRAFGGSGRVSYTELVNLSMNQVLMRSLNTSFVAILPVVCLLVLGAGVLGATALGDFGLALFIGLITGAYSSIFIAAPVLAFLKEREPKWKVIREKLGGKQVRNRALSGAGESLSHASGESILRPGGAVIDDGEALRQVTSGQAPRPRKPGRR